MNDKPAKKTASSSSSSSSSKETETGKEKEASAQNVVTSLPSSTLAGGPSQDDLNPAFAPPKPDSKKDD